MADFFEEFGRMVSDVASDITKKTGDTLEIQKIKSNVRSLKRANERDLADIGRMVYEKFQSGEVSDMDYVTLCETGRRDRKDPGRSINAYTHTRCGRNTVRS